MTQEKKIPAATVLVLTLVGKAHSAEERQLSNRAARYID